MDSFGASLRMDWIGNFAIKNDVSLPLTEEILMRGSAHGLVMIRRDCFFSPLLTTFGHWNPWR